METRARQKDRLQREKSRRVFSDLKKQINVASRISAAARGAYERGGMGREGPREMQYTDMRRDDPLYSPRSQRVHQLIDEDGVLNVRVGDFPGYIQIPVHDFEEMTLHDVIAYLLDEGELEDASFFGHTVRYGGSVIPKSLMSETLAYLDIDDDASVHVTLGRPSTKEEVEAIFMDDPALLTLIRTEMDRVTYDADDRVEDIYLDGSGLVSLPESFGDLNVGGNLVLADNDLVTLPESFSDLAVGGHLVLGSNHLTDLPDSFGKLKIGHDLDLSMNQLSHLPESFGELGTVQGDLRLDNNQLVRLPESFGNLKIRENLYLDKNHLSRLPDSFGDLEVGKARGNLSLRANRLSSLPVSLANIKVGGDLDLRGNPLSHLPDSFRNLRGRLLHPMKDRGHHGTGGQPRRRKV